MVNLKVNKQGKPVKLACLYLYNKIKGISFLSNVLKIFYTLLSHPLMKYLYGYRKSDYVNQNYMIYSSTKKPFHFLFKGYLTFK